MLNEIFFEESIHDHFRIKLQIDKVLAQETSPYQNIFIFTNKDFGTVLALDGIVQTTSADEHIYHEMMSHVPLMALNSLDKKDITVAIIGGGDGGVLREVVKHNFVKHCTMIDIDARVIELSKEHLPDLSNGAFNHKKATVLSEDGAAWIAQAKDLDLVLIDSSDPVGPNESLFNDAFYESLYEALSPDGVVVKQSGCTLVQPQEAIDTLGFYRKYFKTCGLYRQNVPTYVGGDMTFAWASKGNIELNEIIPNEIPYPTKHYHKSVHQSCFALPRELHNKVEITKLLN